MSSQKLIFFFKKNLIDFFIAIIPISYIAGNLVLNLNITLLILSVFFIHGIKVFKVEYNLIDKVILIIFSYIFINGIYNNFFNFNFPSAPDQNLVIKKSFFYMRFLFLYIVLRFVILNKLINFKLVFYSFGLSSLFVSLDILVQLVFGVDFFGYESSDRRLSGPFGDEKIAGSFIQRFFIFLPYSILLFSKINNKVFLNLLSILLSMIVIFGAFFAGNRVPLIMLIISFFLLCLFEIKIRKNFILVFIIFLIGLSFLYFEKNVYRSHYKKFVSQSLVVVQYFKNKILTDNVIAPDECRNRPINKSNQNDVELNKISLKCKKYLNVYIKEIDSGFQTWEKNKLFGGGLRSFRYQCNSIDRSKMEFFVTKIGEVNCNNHPHNYYLQIAAELGIFGLFTIIFLFLLTIVKSLLYINSSKPNYYEKRIFLAFFIIFILEIFPFKTTGSFFTTSNATFLFIMLSFVIGLLNIKKI